MPTVIVGTPGIIKGKRVIIFGSVILSSEEEAEKFTNAIQGGKESR